MLQSNNAALLAGNLDVSGLSEGFRDGQKLRQEYEARQQQKALNEIMKVGDHNGRLELAQQHKYAGALVPLLQKYDEDRQKAALDNLKASADIGKVYGETGKLGAESGKIGAETTGVVRENIANIQNDISALAVTQNPQIFALGLGEMTKQGLISPDRTDMMLKMITTDPQNAAKVMQSMVMANPELAKLFKPEVTYTNLGDRVESQVYDPLANTVTGKGGYKVGQSPDSIADNKTRQYVSDNSLAGTQYSSDNSYDASVYKTDVDSRDRGLKLDQEGNISWAEVAIKQQNANTNQVKAETAAQREQKAKAAMKPAVQTKFLESKNKAKSAYRQVQTISKWQKELESGGLNFSGWDNTKNSIAARIGTNSEQAAKYTEFTAFISSFVNEKLANASGVQTDNDEIRFWKEVTGTGGVPRTNAQAASMLARLKKYSLNEQETYYNDMRSIGNQYGMGIPEYGQGSGKAGSKASSSNKGATKKNEPKGKGASIIGGVLGGG